MIELLGFILLGLVSGFVASTLGVGGGVIFVPALALLFGFSQHIAQGTSLAIIVPTAIVSTVVHARRGRVDWRVAGFVAIGGVVGGFLGSAAALTLDGLVLRRLFAVLLVVFAIRMVSK
ncbi:MAG: sulfite exporter TauE/SafE family protein [bacterium]|nr:sulfite exporter TauE/SafE family protein [bacterium]